MGTKSGYYDIDADEKTCEDTLSAFGLVDDVFYLHDLKQRKLFLFSDITSDAVLNYIRHIMQFNAEDRGIKVEDRKPIILYISSYGGYVDAGLALIDVIQNSKTPVYTVNTCNWYSMGLLIGIAGHKRFTMPNATFLMHDGQEFVVDSSTKVQDRMEFQKRMSHRIKNYIIQRTKVTEEEYNNKLRVEWYMFADEAKEKGFCDYIIGEDFDIDSII